MKKMKNNDIRSDDGVFEKKMDFFFRFFGTSGHPVAAVELSLSDVATNFRSAIDLWRSQGRFIGLNEEHENFQKIQFFQKKKNLKIDPGDYAVTRGPSGGLQDWFFIGFRGSQAQKTIFFLDPPPTPGEDFFADVNTRV